MKFRIRFADQIVGVLIVFALASLVFVVVMLGSSQRWFSKDTSYRTEFASAVGLSRNMPVLYKGFTIGNIKTFNLNEDDQVEVVFTIYEQYHDRVRLGSMVELVTSPIGLGNQFLFHPGKGGDLVDANEIIPSVDSALARSYVRQGLAEEPLLDDSISQLLTRVSTLLDGVNRVVVDLDDALRSGADSSALGQIVGSVARTLADVEALPDTLNKTADSLMYDINVLFSMLERTVASINPVLADINSITTMLAAPDGTVASILDAEGDVSTSLVKSLDSISEIITDLERTVDFIPRQLPQLAGLIADLRVTLRTAEDVLISLTNNPILKGGIPARNDVQSSGTSPRDIPF